MTIILRIFDEIGLGFFVAKSVPSKLSPELKAKRIEMCREMLEILEQIGQRQEIMLLQRVNTEFNETIITAGNGQQIVRWHHLAFMPQMCRKNDDFSLFHSPRICFR
jgi:hypothetical protein